MLAARPARAAPSSRRDRSEIDRELAELRPGWQHDDLRRSRLTWPRGPRLIFWPTRSPAIADAQTELVAGRERLEQTGAMPRPTWRALGERCDAAHLVAVLADESAYLTDRSKMTAIKANWRKSNSNLPRRCAN